MGMAESILLVVLAAFCLTGLVLGIAGIRRRSWGLVLFAAAMVAMPLGFASIVMASP
jgi:hypothetical protein